MAAADAAVTRAKQEQSAQFAPQAYRKAADKYERAQEAMKDRHNTEARRLAEQATADADFATATAEKAKTEKAVTELDQTVQVLEKEVRR